MLSQIFPTNTVPAVRSIEAILELKKHDPNSTIQKGILRKDLAKKERGKFWIYLAWL
jgi:hypothetical protein